ncbi:MAG: hypothetical protein LBD13_08380 [Spirochaetaceae bacterium]|jgi:hypothetical protein|nr:hypothetical protein [Spirochaetaceae bacterium]
MKNMKNMKKRFLRALWAAAASLNAQTEKTPDGLWYKRNEPGGAAITEYTGTDTALH